MRMAPEVGKDGCQDGPGRVAVVGAVVVARSCKFERIAQRIEHEQPDLLESPCHHIHTCCAHCDGDVLEGEYAGRG